MKAIKPALTLLYFFVVINAVTAQSSNLLQNPNAEQGLQHWRINGKASVDEGSTGRRCFVLSNDASIFQDVPVTNNRIGWFAVLIAWATSDGSVADRPSLSGYMLDPGNTTSGHVYQYLQGPDMLGLPKANGGWVKLSGIFKIPEQTGRIRLFLRPGCQTGKTPDHCVSRFRDTGIYLFSTEAEADSFVNKF
jgi:hypothetical protein